MRLSRSALAVTAGVAMLATACGGGSGKTQAAGKTAAPTPSATTASATPTPSPTPTYRRAAGADLVIWADDTRAPVLKPFADAFGKANNVKVVVQQVPFQSIHDNLPAAAPAGEGPDIIVGAHDWLGELVKNGIVAPLDLPDPQDYADVTIKAFTYDGKLYGLPYAYENIALLRNTTLVPTAPKTFAELEQTAMKLKQQGKVDTPLALQEAPTGDTYHTYPLFSGYGGYIFGQNADGTYNPNDLGVDSPGGLTAATALGKFAKEKLISADMSYDIMMEKFGKGKAPFAITGPWAIAQDKTGFKATGVKYAVEPIPPLKAGVTPKVFVGVQGFMVSSFAKNKLLAQTFLLDYMGKKDAQLALFKAGQRPPALKSAYDAVKSDPDLQGFALAGQNGQPMPAIPQMGSVWTAFNNAIMLTLQGKGDPQQQFKNAAEQIRKLIKS